MKKGFTIIELLVASLLLSMIVTVLTMMFNQSSIAWRTGTAGVVDMNKARKSIGKFQDIRDDVLPGLATRDDLNYRTVSLWKKDGEGLRTDRAFEQVDSGDTVQLVYDKVKNGGTYEVNNGSAGQGASMFTVGVRSAGPDGKFDTADDVNTWPEEID